MENEVMFNEGTQSLSMEPTNGGELMPVNQAVDGQPSNWEMAASIGATMAVGYGVGKLFEFLWKKAIVPGYVKAVEKVDEWNAEKDERIARKKAQKNKGKNKDKCQPVNPPDEEFEEGEFTEIDDSDESQDEQSLDKKGIRNAKAINGARDKKNHKRR